MKLTIFFNQNEKKKKKSFQCLKETNVTLRSIKKLCWIYKQFWQKSNAHFLEVCCKKKKFWIHLQTDLHFRGNSMLEMQVQFEELKQSQYYVRMHEHSEIGLFFCMLLHIYSSHNLHVVFSAWGNRQRHKQSQRKQSCFETCNSNSVS